MTVCAICRNITFSKYDIQEALGGHKRAITVSVVCELGGVGEKSLHVTVSGVWEDREQVSHVTVSGDSRNNGNGVKCDGF